MANFKALKIDKEMNIFFEDYNSSDLKRLIDSSYFENPYITNRKKDSEYCTIKVIDCKYDSWWYSSLIDFEFFCRIIYRTSMAGKYVSSFQGIKLINNREIIFRDFSPSDVIII